MGDVSCNIELGQKGSHGVCRVHATRMLWRHLRTSLIDMPATTLAINSKGKAPKGRLQRGGVKCCSEGKKKSRSRTRRALFFFSYISISGIILPGINLPGMPANVDLELRRCDKSSRFIIFTPGMDDEDREHYRRLQDEGRVTIRDAPTSFTRLKETSQTA